MNYKTINVNGKLHVICENKRIGTKSSDGFTHSPKANYQGTGMALCGILKQGETLEEFPDLRKKRLIKWAKINDKLR